MTSFEYLHRHCRADAIHTGNCCVPNIRYSSVISIMRIREEEETRHMWSNIIIFEVTDKRTLFIRKFYRTGNVFLEVKRVKIYVCLRNSFTAQKF